MYSHCWYIPCSEMLCWVSILEAHFKWVSRMWLSWENLTFLLIHVINWSWRRADSQPFFTVILSWIRIRFGNAKKSKLIKSLFTKNSQQFLVLMIIIRIQNISVNFYAEFAACLWSLLLFLLCTQPTQGPEQTWRWWWQALLWRWWWAEASFASWSTTK